MFNKQRALDILREICTIGFGSGATALADLLDAKVEISFPEAKITTLKNLKSTLQLEETFIILEIHIEGDIGGRLSLLLHPREAKILGSNLLKKPSEEIDSEDPLFHSALKESANILAGSYMSALSEATGLNVMSNVPFLSVNKIKVFFDFISTRVAHDTAELFFIKTMMKVQNINFKGLLLFFLDYNSLLRLFDSLQHAEIMLWAKKMKGQSPPK